MQEDSLPIIDISPFMKKKEEQDEEAKHQVAKQMHDACCSWGFFYVGGHGVDPRVVDEAHELARKFFSLEDEKKKEITITNEQGGGVRGYQRLGENVTLYKKDWHEGIDLYREVEAPNLTEEEKQKLSPTERNFFYGRNQWPNEPSNFKESFENYIEIMKGLGLAVMHCMAMSLDLEEDFFDKYIDDSYWVMRIIGYPTLENSDGVGISCGEHCDYGCLTIVNQDSTPGALQVRSVKGEWINANPIPGHFVMNIGDMVRVWTNGLYQSTLHRVIHTSKNNYRTSIPFFFEPNYEAFIEPLPSCVTTENPKKYEGVKYGAHLLGKVSKNFDFNYNQ